MNYEVLVIGSGRTAIDRAIWDAQNGRRVGLIGNQESSPSFDLLRQAARSIKIAGDVSMTASRRSDASEPASGRRRPSGTGMPWRGSNLWHFPVFNTNGCRSCRDENQFVVEGQIDRARL